MTSNISTWLAAACADAERRGLPELKPLLESLARSTASLRAADLTVDDRAPADARGPGGSMPDVPTS